MRVLCCARWSLPMCELAALTGCRGKHKMAHATVRHNRWADECKMDFANAQPARARPTWIRALTIWALGRMPDHSLRSFTVSMRSRATHGVEQP
eukprot:8531272-Alexandrium_andersonii.AAC.1